MYRNDMYDYLKEHAYISKNKKSNYQFELSKERAECIANKFSSLVIDLYQNQWLGRIQDLEQENQELKKQLEEKIISEMKLKDELFNKIKEYQETYKDVRIEIKEYKKQQKEFIEWLENEIALWERKTYEIAIIKDDTAVFVWKIKLELLKEVLSKYKEIVGGSNVR